jgi:hypothetical protein
MTEASTSQPARPQPPEELHWGISYLREDLQDLRSFGDKLEARIIALDDKLETRTAALDDKLS